MRYSISSIILIILIIIRILFQVLIIATPHMYFSVALFFFLLIVGLVYIVSLGGVFFKTNWALVLVIIVALIDASASLVILGDILSIVILAIIDLLMIFLSFNILIRLRRENKDIL